MEELELKDENVDVVDAKQAAKAWRIALQLCEVLASRL